MSKWWGARWLAGCILGSAGFGVTLGALLAQYISSWASLIGIGLTIAGTLVFPSNKTKKATSDANEGSSSGELANATVTYSLCRLQIDPEGRRARVLIKQHSSVMERVEQDHHITVELDEYREPVAVIIANLPLTPESIGPDFEG